MTKFGKIDKKPNRFKRANDCGYDTWQNKHFCFTDLFHNIKKVTIIIL